jgi:hypothetical protein
MVCERSMVNLDGSGSLALSKGMPEHLCLRVWRIFIPKLKLLQIRRYLDVRSSQDMVKDCDCNSLNSGRAMGFLVREHTKSSNQAITVFGPQGCRYRLGTSAMAGGPHPLQCG